MKREGGKRGPAAYEPTTTRPTLGGSTVGSPALSNLDRGDAELALDEGERRAVAAGE
jgi:hypothetical protein